MFVVMYDLSDMPPNHRTFLRQRTMYVPLTNTNTNTNATSSSSNQKDDLLKSYLRYLIHLRYIIMGIVVNIIFLKYLSNLFKTKICDVKVRQNAFAYKHQIDICA